MEPTKLFRSKKHMLAGVCSGIADYLKISKIIVRAIFVALAFAYLVGVFLYLLMWLIVPEEQQN